jgi:ABC-2 type transport system permease protein
MGDLLAAQVIALRTTRTAIWIAGVLAGYVVLSAWAPALFVGGQHAPHTMLEATGGLSVTIGYLAGGVLTAGQYRHGLARALLLARPSRTAVHAAHLGTATLAGAVLGVLDAGLGVAAQASSGQLNLPTSETLRVAAGVVAATTAATIIGAAIGTITRSLPLAVAAPLLWIYVVEPLIAQVSYPLYTVLPGGVREALLRHTSPHHHIPGQLTGLAIAAAWCLTFAATSGIILARRDIE